MGNGEILTIIKMYSNHPSIVTIWNYTSDPKSRVEFFSVSDEYVYGLLKGMGTKTYVGYDIISVIDLTNMRTPQWLFPEFGELSPQYKRKLSAKIKSEAFVYFNCHLKDYRTIAIRKDDK